MMLENYTLKSLSYLPVDKDLIVSYNFICEFGYPLKNAGDSRRVPYLGYGKQSGNLGNVGLNVILNF